MFCEAFLIPIVFGSTCLTNPISHSEPCDTFRPRSASTKRTGSGCIGLFDLKENATASNGFIAEHCPEIRPSVVQHRLGHSGLRHFR